MKTVNVEFGFSKDCPYNLSGVCCYQGIGLKLSLEQINEGVECGIGKSEPPTWCPLPDVENSENKEQKITTHNMQSTAVAQIAAEMDKECAIMKVPEASEVRSYIRKWARQLRALQ
jgi:ribosomal protein L6P/L9E